MYHYSICCPDCKRDLWISEPDDTAVALVQHSCGAWVLIDQDQVPRLIKPEKIDQLFEQ